MAVCFYLPLRSSISDPGTGAGVGVGGLTDYPLGTVGCCFSSSPRCNSRCLRGAGRDTRPFPRSLQFLLLIENLRSGHVLWPVSHFGVFQSSCFALIFYEYQVTPVGKNWQIRVHCPCARTPRNCEQLCPSTFSP